jgi:hypothetical protein
MLALRYYHDMSEEPASNETMPRPGWRYIDWHGWNLLALGWIGIGIVVGFLTNLICTPRLRDVKLSGTVAIAFGVSVVVADLICRWRDPEANRWRRYVSRDAGGAVLFVPSWLIGLWIVGTGIVTLLVRA